MSSEQERDRSRRQSEVERLVQQTEEALVNTRHFLEELDASNTAAHEQIRMFANDLRRKLERLKDES